MAIRSAAEKYVQIFLPPRLCAAYTRAVSFNPGCVTEIRLRQNGPFSVRINEREIDTGLICSAADVAYTVRSLSGNSLYSHAETIKDGYICADGGIRAGVCGRAVTRGGVIEAVTDITSVNVRIPHRIPGAADQIINAVGYDSLASGLLIWSKPGVGKTTVLKELVRKLSSGASAKRVAVVDTRFELCAGTDGERLLADFLCGYPRGKGIEIAVRTLCPDFVVCDEISTREDALAVEEAALSGVSVIASSHASTSDEVESSPVIKNLISKKVFGCIVGLAGRRDGKYLLETSHKEVKRGGGAAAS